MLEYSFVQFSSSRTLGCLFPKPISVGEKILFYSTTTMNFHLYSSNGVKTYDSAFTAKRIGSYYILEILNLGAKPNNGECVYFKAYSGTLSKYSSDLVYVSDTDGLSKVSYRCNENAFGFPFEDVDMDLVSWLPINLKNPQLKQEEKTYVKRTGEVVVLMAKYYKEWEAESEYIPEEWHDNMVAILSCDSVYINDVRMTKSDSYEIEWDNTIKKACGQKLAKATWKMRANTMERNSNC